MNFNYEEDVPEINSNIQNDAEDDRLAKELEMMLSGSPDQFSDSKYWEHRYTENSEPFEWYFNFEHFLPFIEKRIELKGKAANIGCGTSAMGMDLIKAGFSHVVCTDISNVAISVMKNRYKDEKNLEFVVDDCLNTKLEENSYDCIFDKGTIDALFCNEHPGRIARAIFSGVLKALKKGGYFVAISFGDMEDRQKYFEKEEFDWKLLDVITVPNEIGTPHFIYLCQKN